MERRQLRFGSLLARLLLSDVRYGGDIAHIFGVPFLHAEEVGEEEVGVEIELHERPIGAHGRAVEVPPDGMILRHDPLCPEIHTEALSVFLRIDNTPTRIRIEVLQPDLPHFDLCVHFAVVFHKLLFLLDRVVLHGAAIEFEGKVALFLGDKGAGKSTIALRLARAGGIVLGEDHLVLHRTPAGFLVSGCDERSRLTEKTEAYFFDRKIDIVPQDFAGTMKKEVPASQLFDSRPYEDAPVHYLFFPRVGERVAPTPLSGREILLELMQAVGKLQRFVDPADRMRFLDLLAEFTPSVQGFRLELSEDLGALDELVEFLRRLPSPSA